MVFAKVVSASYILSQVKKKRHISQKKSKKAKKSFKSVKKAKEFCGLRQKATKNQQHQ